MSIPNSSLPTGMEDFIFFAQQLCTPQKTHICDGSSEEAELLIQEMLQVGTLEALHADYPHCYLHRSNPRDVARVEDRTFICTTLREDAGPTNHWMAPDEARAKLSALFAGCMEGRTMYVVPYVMGPVDSPYAGIGVEITDSPYVVLSMRTMTRIGAPARERIDRGERFVPGLHSVGQLDPETRYICHFPETREIWSFGSGYGGNALLGKKCHALRIASVIARDEMWLAEHMMIVELTSPEGDRVYFAGAFPSACGKTNLAMLPSPLPGWTTRTVGDDIAWMHVGDDGRLWAINPEAGFFGVAPGTSVRTNPAAMATIQSDTIFTNVGVSDDGKPWWEGIEVEAPEFLTDWKGERRPTAGATERFAQPNARFTAPAKNCPTLSPHWEDPQGVPISGILFGGRRNDTMPLVLQANSWQHGVFLGATMASQTTAAAEGAQGVLRRDPMAMLPFCGYHMGDYFAHWLAVGEKLTQPPLVFHVNWFQKDADGKFLWPGYGDNLRALLWMRERVLGIGKGVETPIGTLPTPDALHTEGLTLAPETLAHLLSVDSARWREECDAIAEHFQKFGDRLPVALGEELAALRARLG